MSRSVRSRRTFVRAVLAPVAVLAGGALTLVERLGAQRPSGAPRTPPAPPEPVRTARPRRHPVPRPNVTSAAVLPAAALHGDAAAVAVFAMVRAIPHVMDGLRCTCSCADLPGHYSLLSCFEDQGMAAHCATCQAQARLAYEGFTRGRSLEEIRAAMDRAFT